MSVSAQLILNSFDLLVTGTRSLSMSDYLVGLESSGWLRHIKAIVDAAVFLTRVNVFGLYFFNCILSANQRWELIKSNCCFKNHISVPSVCSLNPRR